MPGDGCRLALCCLMVLLLQGCVTHRDGPSPVAAPAIRDVVHGFEARRDYSGVTLVTGKDGTTILSDARGLADKAAGTPVTGSTRFQIASISKLFVAVAVLRQVDRGTLRLEERIGTYIPGLPPQLAQLTLSELMAHTAGLRRDSPFRPDEALTVAGHVARLTDSELVAPRGQYSYSNTGHVLLARAVELATGKPFDMALQADVLEPAGLADTGFILGDAEVPRLAVGYARGIDGWRIPPRARHRGIYPPGGLYATAGDLTRFMRLLRAGKLLSRASTRALFRPRAAIAPGQTASFAGVSNARKGEEYLLVAGSADGGKAVLMEAMHAHRTTVILSNVGDIPVTEMLRDIVIATEGGVPAPPAPCQLADAATFTPRAGIYIFTGTGLDALAGTDPYRVGLVIDKDRAFLWDSQDESMTLLCEGPEGDLAPAYTRDIRLSFGSEAGVPVMVLDWDGQVFRATRKPWP